MSKGFKKNLILGIRVLSLILLIFVVSKLTLFGSNAELKVTKPTIKEFSEFSVPVRLRDGKLIKIVLESNKPVLEPYWKTIAEEIKVVINRKTMKTFLITKDHVYRFIIEEIYNQEFLKEYQGIKFSIIRTEFIEDEFKNSL